MKRIDAHQHFWEYDPVRDGWISADMQVIRRNFLPHDLLLELYEHGMDGCVVVQSDQSEAENTFQLSLAAQHDFIKGVVGWVDLKAANLEEQLFHLKRFKKLKGFRHVLQAEPDDDFMLQPDFMRGVDMLHRYGFTYDLLVFPRHLPYANTLVSAFPEQPFVIDHLAKPAIKAGDIKTWKKDLMTIAAHKNVWCKISGMVTEADWQHWSVQDFAPYLDAVFEAFGTGRVMFSSDWPVCLVAASYRQVTDIVQQYVSRFSEAAQSDIWGGNATRFYQLDAE